MLILKERIDRVLVDLEIVPSRNKAQALIKAGAISVNGVVAKKANQLVSEEDDFVILNDPCPWVSRAGLKMVHAIEYFKPKFSKDTVCLDIGASTGGFTQVLLSHDVREVFAVDVGTDQLHDSLCEDSRVIVLEKTDARNLDVNMFPPIDVIVVDVSFVGIEKILSVPLSLAKSGAWVIALIKPQFQVGRTNIGRGGIVKENGAVDACLKSTEDFFTQNDWLVQEIIPSCITGADGNQEYCLYALKK